MHGDGNASRRAFWMKQAGRVRRRVNMAWWLETLVTPLLAISLVGSAALLWVRREVTGADPLMLSLIAGIIIAVLALACFALAARRFEHLKDSMVRIEAAMRLRNGLSAAEAGVTPWPAPVAHMNAGLHWHWPRVLIPLAGSLVLLAAGLWIPVGARSSESAGPPEPQAWRQLAAETEFLAEEQLVEEPYLDELQKQLDELRSRNEDEWFSHSSLEATDSLVKSHRAETGRLRDELDRAKDALEKLKPNEANAAQRDRQVEEFEQALQGLQNGAMKPNAELLAQLEGLDLQNLEALDPAQMAQLQEKLEQQLQALNELPGNAVEPQDEGEGEKEEEGPPNGNGGIDRGPGHAPGVLGKPAGPLDIGESTPLPTGDLSQTSAGDLLEISRGEHEVDTSASHPTSGGAVESQGKGGDRIWRESLDPDEQDVLKRFFD